MNNIHANTDPCSSCGLCVVSCPHDAIVFGRNSNGFYDPTVLADICTNCGICIRVCYKYLEIKTELENTFREKSVYGAWSKNIETVKSSSSGGVVHELTTHFFRKGYKVCGCIFDATNDNCKHIIVEKRGDLDALRTSKYLQSNTVEAFLQFKKDEKYLVIGTPCQIYGLRKYIQLKKWENNFVLIDFFCHGTPSFNLWKKYKEYLSKKHGLSSKLTNVNFREKNLESKWHSYAILIQDFLGQKFLKNKAFRNDLFFKFFLNNSCLNDACYHCKLRLDHCAADIRVADFWGKKYIDNEWGVSLVTTNTEKGQQIFDEIKPNLEVEICTFEDLLHSQHTRFITPNKKRQTTLKELQGENSLAKIYLKHFGFNNWYRKSIVGRGFSFIKRNFLKIYAN